MAQVIRGDEGEQTGVGVTLLPHQVSLCAQTQCVCMRTCLCLSMCVSNLSGSDYRWKGHIHAHHPSQNTKS